VTCKLWPRFREEGSQRTSIEIGFAIAKRAEAISPEVSMSMRQNGDEMAAPMIATAPMTIW